MSQSASSALSSLRVLDLSRVLAGPWATQILADMGADVIKVERPGSGDETRHWGPPWVGTGESEQVAAYYLCANRNKRSIAVDVSTPEGPEIVRALARQCDVLVENFKHGTLARYGLDFSTLKVQNPHLVYCSITGFGHTGPYADRAGYDFLIQAMGGLMSMTGQPEGEPGGEPTKVGVAVTDILTGLYAANAIQAALLSRQKTGKGQHIDMALLDVQIASLANQAMNYLVCGKDPVRLGNAHPNIVPYQTFPTADGDMVLAIGNDGQFARFCTEAGEETLAQDVRFATNAARVENRQALIPKLRHITTARTTAAWVAALQACAVPCGPVNNVSDVFADVHVQARDMQVLMHHDVLGDLSLVANPMRLSQTPPRYRQAPPTLGEHTDDVLQSVLALSPERIDQLRQAQVIA